MLCLQCTSMSGIKTLRLSSLSDNTVTVVMGTSTIASVWSNHSQQKKHVSVCRFAQDSLCDLDLHPLMGFIFLCRGWKAYFLWRTLVFLQLTNLPGDYKRCERTCVVLPVQIVVFLFEQWWVSVCLVCTYGRSSPNWNLSCLKQQ